MLKQLKRIAALTAILSLIFCATAFAATYTVDFTDSPVENAERFPAGYPAAGFDWHYVGDRADWTDYYPDLNAAADWMHYKTDVLSGALIWNGIQFNEDPTQGYYLKKLTLPSGMTLKSIDVCGLADFTLKLTSASGETKEYNFVMGDPWTTYSTVETGWTKATGEMSFEIIGTQCYNIVFSNIVYEDTPAETSSGSSSASGGKDVPVTGDTSDITLCITLCAASVAGVALVYRKKRFN